MKTSKPSREPLAVLIGAIAILGLSLWYTVHTVTSTMQTGEYFQAAGASLIALVSLAAIIDTARC